MNNIIKEIDALKGQLKIKQEKFKNISDKIKLEINERYYTPNDESNFRYALSFVIGEFIEKYSMQSLYKIKASKSFDDNVYQNYYDISKEFHEFGYPTQSERVGFICYKKNLFNAFGIDYFKFHYGCHYTSFFHQLQFKHYCYCGWC